MHELRDFLQKRICLACALVATELQKTGCGSVRVARLAPGRFGLQQPPIGERPLNLPGRETAYSDFPERDIMQAPVLGLDYHRALIALDSERGLAAENSDPALTE